MFDAEAGSHGHGRVFTSDVDHSGSCLDLSGRGRARGFLCFCRSQRMDQFGVAFAGFLRSKVFSSKFHVFVLSRRFLHTARHVVTVRNYCFPAHFPQTSQVDYLNLPTPPLMTTDHLTA